MKTYSNPQELVNIVHEAFLERIRQSGIYPTPETVIQAQSFMQTAILRVVASGDVPGSYEGGYIVAPKLQELENNTDRLVDELISQARQKNSDELLAWSWQDIKNALCPLFPFFPPPCN